MRLGETGIGERGDIVLGWLVRLCVVILVAGLVLFDAISVGLAHMSVGDDAQAAAQAAADSWHSHPDAQTAYDAAVAAIADRPADAAVADSFTVDADGTVRVRVDRTASTLMLFRVHRLAHYAGADATGMARFAG